MSAIDSWAFGYLATPPSTIPLRADVLDTVPGANRETVGPVLEPTFTKCASHLAPALSPRRLREIVAEAVPLLEAFGHFDAYAATGLSGVMFASALAFQTGKPFAVVRKEEIPAPNSPRPVEGPDVVRSYVFVDDLVCSGTTLLRAMRGMSERYPGAECVGIYCYCTRTERYNLPDEFRGRIIR